MWTWLAAHKHDVELVAACWFLVQIFAGMPTPNGTGITTTVWYRWIFNVGHSITNLPRLLATTFPQVGWIAGLFGIKQDTTPTPGPNLLEEKKP